MKSQNGSEWANQTSSLYITENIQVINLVLYITINTPCHYEEWATSIFKFKTIDLAVTKGNRAAARQFGINEGQR